MVVKAMSSNSLLKKGRRTGCVCGVAYKVGHKRNRHHTIGHVQLRIARATRTEGSSAEIDPSFV